MKLLGPTRFHRLNEAGALVFLVAGLCLTLSLISYYPQDPSWNSASGAARAHNLIGLYGSYTSDFFFQLMGFGALGIPVLLWMLAWRWIRSDDIGSPWVKASGSVLFFLSVCTALSIGPEWRPWNGAFSAGGILGVLIADSLKASLNMTGAVLLTSISLILSIYLISTFSMAKLAIWLSRPLHFLTTLRERWSHWRAVRREMALEKAQVRAERRAEARAEKEAALAAKEAAKAEKSARRSGRKRPDIPVVESLHEQPAGAEPATDPEEIPIHMLEYEPPPTPPIPAPVETAAPVSRARWPPAPEVTEHPEYRLPATDLLNEVPGRSAFDSMELKEIAVRIKNKFEEFNVHGNVTQINPGPVVTTFEFKPEAGIKYSRITTLSEDLCLGLQAESILIERIPGKPTVGIEVPNTRRELISLRQILESEEFGDSNSRLTICLGKDISGRIKVSALESMPHLLIAGSTGAGKSVMLNSMIMSILYKATPDEVRMILVDPKRLEMGLYEGIPHLLTPVITDAKKATNALRNAVLEMERRLKLLAAQGVRNIDQYNRKVRQLQNEPRSLFEDEDVVAEELTPLPYILILIDELADLMMVERANVEEAVTRLAQMARAVGMHLVLATQRPSVDVITG